MPTGVAVTIIHSVLLPPHGCIKNITKLKDNVSHYLLVKQMVKL